MTTAEAAPRTAKKRRNRIALIALIVVAVLILGGALYFASRSASSSSTNSNVQTAQVTKTDMVVTVSGTGSTVPVDSTDVYPDSSGKVDQVYVSVGDKVKKGDALFRLDSQSLDTALNQAHAQLKQSKQQVITAEQQRDQAYLQYTQAKNTLANLQSAPPTQTKPGQETYAQQLDVAEQQVEIARDGYAAAQVGVSTAITNRDNAQQTYDDALTADQNATVYAPVDGTVIALNVTAGGNVSGSASSSGGSVSGAASTSSGGSSAPVTIADVHDLKASVSINEVDIAKVKPGQEATVTFDAITGLSIHGKVTWVSPTGTSSNGVVTYACDVSLSKQDSRLRPNMNATADIMALKVPGALVVPNAAVKVNGTTNFVQVMAPDGTTANVTVTTGISNDTYTQLTSGVKEGETVVTSSGTVTTGGGGFGPFGGGGLRVRTGTGGGGTNRAAGGGN